MNQERVLTVIRENYNFLKGMYIKDTVDADFGVYSYSSVDYGDTDVFWNHAVLLQNTDNLEEKMDDIEMFYQEKGKNSAFYLPVLESVKDSLTALKKNEFEEVFTDVWMFYNGEMPKGNENVELEEIDSEGRMEEFVDLFYRSHAADLDDPYAGLSEQYGEQLKDKFGKDFDSFRIKHSIVKYRDESVGHITLVENGKMAAIYNLGTIPNYRGKGIATAALRKTINELGEKNLEHVFLQTEKGSKNEDFFSTRGFDTKFQAECLTK